MKNAGTHKKSLIALTFGCLMMFSFQSHLLTGQTVKETRDVSAFEGVALAFSGDIYITQGSPQKVVIEADKNTMEIIETRVEGSKLILKTQNGNWRNLGDIKVYITMPRVNYLSISGSGDMICETGISTQEIKVDVSGSGSVRVNKLASEEVEAVITGSGDIALTGSGNAARELDVTITGSGSFKGADLPAGEADVTITGSGSATVQAVNELETNITGSGSVLYRGRPLVNASATGSGKTRPVD
jgi:hypothetical protein